MGRLTKDQRETGNSKGDAMTADEFRKTLDSFHEALKRADDFVWRGPHPHLFCRPEWSLVLDQAWRDLNRHCALMKDAERRDDDVAV